MTGQRKGSLDGEGLATLLDILSCPSPAMHVRIVLKVYRDRGTEFEFAWAQAMRTLPRAMPEAREWKEQFHAQKHHWRRAYERTGALPDEPRERPQGDVAQAL